MAYKTYSQSDSRWGKKNYDGSSMSNSGCGPTAVADLAFAVDGKTTPWDVAKWMKSKGYAVRGQGTAWAGIPAAMKHFGLTNVKNVAKMSDVFNYISKGYCAVFLMTSGSRGGCVWTTSGHFIAVTGYKHKNGKHYFYTRDPGWRDHTGWYCYEDKMRGLIPQVWVGIAKAKTPEPVPKKPTGKYSGAIPKPVLKKGAKGTQVKYLQKFLNWYLGIKLAVDGIFGDDTFNALKQFQRTEGIKVDGAYGNGSYKRAKSYYKAPEPPKPTPEPTPTPKADKYKVIDVSEFQGKIDWAKVKSDGVVGAIIRYADGDYLDPDFKYNMENAKANGLHVGAYIFSRAKTKAGSEKEATRLFNACKPYAPDLPLYIDLEDSKLSKYANTVAQAFIAKIKALGGKAGVYANLNWWNNYLAKTAPLSFAMWLADWGNTIHYKPKNYVGMWQYSSSGKVKGISGRVDMNWLYQRYWEAPEPVKKKTNAEKIADKAKEFAYAYGTKKSVYAYPTGKPKEAYKKGLQTAYGDRKGWGKQTKAGASCDVFAGTCIRCSEYDKNFPRGLDQQIPYIKKSSLWTKQDPKKLSDLKAGDVVIYKKKTGGGHICIYIGGGKVCEAGYNSKRYGCTTKKSDSYFLPAKNKDKKFFGVYRCSK